MAQCLTVALKASIVVSKKKLSLSNISQTLAQSTVENNFDLSLYELYETDHNLIWKLKDSVLETEFTPFLNAVFKLYYEGTEVDFQGFIKEASRVKTYAGILKVANEEVFDHFVLDNTQNSQIHLKKEAKHLSIDFTMIQFFKTERMRMDKFDTTMAFIERAMQKAFSEFQLNKALELYVFDDKYAKK